MSCGLLRDTWLIPDVAKGPSVELRTLIAYAIIAVLVLAALTGLYAHWSKRKRRKQRPRRNRFH